MPSIRRSLIVYFLILLLVALGAVGLLVDRFAADMKRSWQVAESDRIEQEYTFRCKETERQFDEELEDQAVKLGRELRAKYVAHFSLNPGPGRRPDPERDTEYRKFHRLGAGAVAGSAVTGLANELPGVRSWVYWNYMRYQTDEQVRRMFAAEGDEHPKYYQFHFPSRSRRVLRNPYPNNDLPSLPIDEYNLNPKFTSAADNVAVGGVPVRRIVHKSFLTGGPPRLGQGVLALPALVGAHAPPLPPALLDRNFDPLPFVYVQVGRPKAELDALLSAHEAKREADQKEMVAYTNSAMADLRTRLALIGVIALIAVTTGAWLLVGRGVAPIRKLSEAVSRVSEKDFRLPIKQDDLSLELLPIHDRLTQTLDELRRAFDREKQSVADISHELKTPLAALLTSIGVSLRKPRSAEQYKATLEECRDIGRQLSRLVDRIMTLASLDAGNDRMQSERVDASDVATECAIVIRPLAEAHGQTLATAIDSDAEMVTDPDKLREVLNNLLHNAIEYNRPGGSVELRVTANRGKVTFAVHDTGIGMTPDVQAKIFERFYRADPSRTQTGVHAGLGLAIVREYVERLGGSVAVESEPGVGSTFRVTLPTNGADGNGSVGRSGYTPSLAHKARSAAGAD
ncbi:MAG TPA: HAMP domain-containing sensor histidine kinase [Fimbriiglobus sp.]|jgi:signal transduction histidine kinase|nr:HAMP domain-containing sensor histidine kinase [Fimbriiglobus sp.]